MEKQKNTINDVDSANRNSTNKGGFKSECKRFLVILGVVCIIVGTVAGIFVAIKYINTDNSDALMAFFVFFGVFFSSAISALLLFALAEILEALEKISGKIK